HDQVAIGDRPAGRRLPPALLPRGQPFGDGVHRVLRVHAHLERRRGIHGRQQPLKRGQLGDVVRRIAQRPGLPSPGTVVPVLYQDPRPRGRSGVPFGRTVTGGDRAIKHSPILPSAAGAAAQASAHSAWQVTVPHVRDFRSRLLLRGHSAGPRKFRRSLTCPSCSGNFARRKRQTISAGDHRRSISLIVSVNSRLRSGGPMRMSKTAASGLALAVLAVSAAVTVASPASAATTLVVNADQPFRPVTHVATGSLYGLASATVPADSLVEPLHPNTFVQMPAGGHQQPTGDILKVAPEAQRAGAKLVDRLSDYYAGWPYQFSWSTWPNAVSSQIQQVKAAGVSSLASWELWNEPDNTWLSANGTFESFWTRTYQQVRSLDATTPIQGPSFSDNISDMQNFLRNAVATDTVPDIISWHELESSTKIAGDVSTVTGLEKSLGISPRPIAIEEYAAPAQVGVPGALVGYIAQFERLGIHDAELAFWNQSGALGDLLTGQGGSPNGAYWLYDWYAAMSGNMVATTPPGGGLDGAAAVNSAQNQVSVVFGGGSGSTAVTVSGLSALSGFSGSSQVTATLQDTPSPGRTVAVSAPTTLSQSTYTVSNGSITVPISSMNSAYGYHLTVTPVSSSGDTVTVTNPGSQSGTVGTAISAVQ